LWLKGGVYDRISENEGARRAKVVTSSDGGSKAGISLSDLVAVVTSLAVFTSPLYLLGLLELQRLYLLAYRLSRATAWHVAYLTPTTITTREGLSLAVPAMVFAMFIGLLGLVVAALLWEKVACASRNEFIALGKLRKQDHSEHPKWFYFIVYTCTAVVCILAYRCIYIERGLSDSPAWARETGAPWWAFILAGLIAALGACIPIFGYVRKVSLARWVVLAIILTYVPALFTAYWDSVKPGPPALNALPLPEVVLCIKIPSVAQGLVNSNLSVKGATSDAVWGDLVDNSNGYWHVLVNKYYGPAQNPTVTRHYVKHARVDLYSWAVHPSDQLAYIPDDSVGRVIAPNAIPPQINVSPPDICRAPLPYELLPDPGKG